MGEKPRASGLRESETAAWKRLDELVARAHGQTGPRRLLRAPVSRGGIVQLDAEEIGELGRLYRAAASRLAQLKTFGASARRLESLNRLVARAHAVVYGRSPRSSAGRVVRRSFLVFPELVRRTWLFHVAAATMLLFGFCYGYYGTNEDLEWALLFSGGDGGGRTPFAETEELRQTLLDGRQANEMGVAVKSQFAAMLWGHNTRIALLALISGILLGIPTLLLLAANGALLGVYTATFAIHGLSYEWWAWILPHGVTELLAVVLLSGAGLLVGWRTLAPGSLTRGAALAEIRPTLLYFLLFAFPMLLVAALIESFVRQSALSDPARYAFAGATALFWALYLGCVRLPSGVASREREQATVTEIRVPLPDERDLMPLGRD